MLHPDGEALLRREVEVIDGTALDQRELLVAVAEAHGLHASWPGGVTAEVIEAGRNLEVIGSPGSGADMIDLAAATARAIPVVHARGAGYKPVAETAIGLMLGVVKCMARFDRWMHAEKRYVGRERYEGPHLPHELEGKTLGVVGFGFIGRDLAEKCRLAFGMRVLAYDPYFDPDEAARQKVTLVPALSDLLAEADLVSVHTPLTPETRCLFGEAEFRRMKPTAYFINCARGPTMDQDALVRALREGWIAGAGLDVYDPEPLSDGHPLFDLENVMLSPHVGSWTSETLSKLATTTAAEMLAVLRGERPRHLVNPAVWPVFLERKNDAPG
jgi:phosphoglycerate dehydrogenase-like enzyme